MYGVFTTHTRNNILHVVVFAAYLPFALKLSGLSYRQATYVLVSLPELGGIRGGGSSSTRLPRSCSLVRRSGAPG